MTTTTFTVTGMACDDCVRAVSDAVKTLSGVVDVGIDLATGEMTLVSSAPVDDVLVRVAVAEAGYELVG